MLSVLVLWAFLALGVVSVLDDRRRLYFYVAVLERQWLPVAGVPGSTRYEPRQLWVKERIPVRNGRIVLIDDTRRRRLMDIDVPTAAVWTQSRRTIVVTARPSALDETQVPLGFAMERR